MLGRMSVNLPKTILAIRRGGGKPSKPLQISSPKDFRILASGAPESNLAGSHSVSKSDTFQPQRGDTANKTPLKQQAIRAGQQDDSGFNAVKNYVERERQKLEAARQVLFSTSAKPLKPVLKNKSQAPSGVSALNRDPLSQNPFIAGHTGSGTIRKAAQRSSILALPPKKTLPDPMPTGDANLDGFWKENPHLVSLYSS